MLFSLLFKLVCSQLDEFVFRQVQALSIFFENETKCRPFPLFKSAEIPTKTNEIIQRNDDRTYFFGIT